MHRECDEKALEANCANVRVTQSTAIEPKGINAVCEYENEENADTGEKGWVFNGEKCIQKRKCTSKGWITLPITSDDDKNYKTYSSSTACCMENKETEYCENKYLSTGTDSECEAGSGKWFKLKEDGEPGCEAYTCDDWDGEGNLEWGNEENDNMEHEPGYTSFKTASKCCEEGEDNLCSSGESWDALYCKAQINTEYSSLSISAYSSYPCSVPLSSSNSQLKSMDSLRENQDTVRFKSGWNSFYNSYKDEIKLETLEEYCSESYAFKLKNGKLKRHESNLKPGETYMIKSKESCRLVTSSEKVSRDEIVLEEGWNIVGSSQPVSIKDITESCKNPYVYRSNGNELKTIEGDLKGKTGYLVRVDEGCTIDLQG